MDLCYFYTTYYQLNYTIKSRNKYIKTNKYVRLYSIHFLTVYMPLSNHPGLL